MHRPCSLSIQTTDGSDGFAWNYKGDFGSKEDIPWAAEELTEVTVAHHVAFVPLPEMVLQGIDGSHVRNSVGDANIATVPALQDFLVAGPAV